MLGQMFYMGEGIPQNYIQGVHWYTKAAEQGLAVAQYNLALIYYNGDGVPQDYKEALKWYTKAAEQGDADAQYTLGNMYSKGEGISHDYKKAAKWYTKAAEKGNADAQYNLGNMYAEGRGISQDCKEAVKWYTKAAEQGNAYAQNNLGSMYSKGKGVLRDYKQAVLWYIKAADQRHSSAQYNLGNMYFKGEGVSLDYKQAANWYTKAAEQGNAYAQYNLGAMYANGKGVPQNYTNSYVWFNLAASQGDEDAAKGRDQTAFLLSPQQLAQAQELAIEIQYEINHPDNPEKTFDQSSHPPSVTSTREPEIKSSGTGFIITMDGYLLTCLHVIEGAEIIKVVVGEDIQPAKEIRTDTNNDLALLKISGSFNALSFSPKRTAAMGEDVFTIGYPNPGLQGVNPKLTNGTINSLTGFKDDLRLYQISIPVQPGNSGGPLLDGNGNIYGVIVAMLDAEVAFKASGSLPQNVNYAVKSAYAQALLDTLPEVSEKLLPPTPATPFEDVVKRVEKSIVMVLVY